MPTKKQLNDFRKTINAWTNTNSNDSMDLVAVYASDRRQLNELLELIAKNKKKEAAELAARLDTIVRDVIPQGIFNWLTSDENERIPKISKDPNRNWYNDSIQFPRLITEASAAGAFTSEVVKSMAISMDLTEHELVALLDRAQKAWARIIRSS